MEKGVFATRPLTFSDELADFRANRLALMSSDSHPLKLKDGAKVVLHLVPRDGFDRMADHDLRGLESPLLPLFTGGSSRFNFDGRLTYSNGEGEVRSYVQMFLNGAIEAVYVFSEWNGQKVIPSAAFERSLIDGIRSYLNAQQTLGVKLPVAVLLTLLHARHFKLAVNDRFWQYDSYLIDRDTLLFPEHLFESFEVVVAQEMRQLFNRLWNAAGFPACLHYDKDGKWVG